ncbi:hypothetical protein CBR_g9177 [Chara braunii]|uniref:Uncharacterized protein n=1 Tax=Chara braunii TaxID=69332 RepID=A0A388KNY7_CHABU|nr:hypothetical protein CBR_g9177 [Chara braunii]|eukprot:GBG71769.1 hypothetical protein CBR_g9177 [Chara braunii]
MNEPDGKWSRRNKLGAAPFNKKAREALVEHLSVMNPKRRLSDVNAYAGQKLDELYHNKMPEFRAPFYTLETAPSRSTDCRMPQPLSGGQHPGGGGGGDEGDGGGDGGDGSGSHGGDDGGDVSGSHGGGDGGDGSGSVGGGEGGDGSRSPGKGSGEKGSGGKGSGGKESGGMGSGGKGSGRKGSGRNRRAFGSHESRETDSHCVGNRDSDMRDEVALKSYQVRVDSHLSARTLFSNVEESSSHHTQPTSPLHNTLLLRLLEKGERLLHTETCAEQQNHSLAGIASSFCLEARMPALRRSESASVSSLSSGKRRKLRIKSELLTASCGPSASRARRKVRTDSELLMSPCRPSVSSAPHATVLQSQENVRSNPPHLQLGTVFPCSPPFSYVETQDWKSRKMLEGLAAGVLETGGSEYERHASERVSVDFETKSTSAPGKEELSSGAHVQEYSSSRERGALTGSACSAARRGDSTVDDSQSVEGARCRSVGTGASERECQASEGASIDLESKSTTSLGVEELSQEAHALQREEDTQHWPAREVLKGVDAGVLETGASEHERQASGGASVDSESKSTATPGEEELSQEAHALQREEETQHWPAREVLKGLDARVLVTGTYEEVLHSRSVVATMQEGDVKGGEELVVEGGEVAVDVQMDPARKDHDSPSTRCGEEEGDRASVLSTGREMVLHEAIELGSESTATELVSDSTVAEVQNVESSVDIGTVARQEGDLP